MNNYNLSLTTSQAESYALQYLPESVAANWLSCKQAEATRQYGFHAWPLQVTPSKVEAEFMWVPLPAIRGGLGSTDHFHLDLEGVQAGAEPINQKWRANEQQTITYNRQIGRDFMLDITVGGTAQSIAAIVPPPPPPPKATPASMACGRFQSGAQASAVETGQAPGWDPKNQQPEASWVNVPFDDTSVETNSNNAGAWSRWHAMCDSATTDSGGFDMQISFASASLASWPPEDHSAYAWAHWSPIWKSTLTLPSNDSEAPYTVHIAYQDIWGSRLNPNRPPQPCGLSIDTNNWSVHLNQSGNAILSLQPGKHLVQLLCTRHDDTTFDEIITVSFGVQRGT